MCVCKRYCLLHVKGCIAIHCSKPRRCHFSETNRPVTLRRLEERHAPQAKKHLDLESWVGFQSGFHGIQKGFS